MDGAGHVAYMTGFVQSIELDLAPSACDDASKWMF
jgi:hypothetical protein